jgi:hypothetical protein
MTKKISVLCTIILLFVFVLHAHDPFMVQVAFRQNRHVVREPLVHGVSFFVYSDATMKEYFRSNHIQIPLVEKYPSIGDVVLGGEPCTPMRGRANAQSESERDFYWADVNSELRYINLGSCPTQADNVWVRRNALPGHNSVSRPNRDVASGDRDYDDLPAIVGCPHSLLHSNVWKLSDRIDFLFRIKNFNVGFIITSEDRDTYTANVELHYQNNDPTDDFTLINIGHHAVALVIYDDERSSASVYVYTSFGADRLVPKKPEHKGAFRFSVDNAKSRVGCVDHNDDWVEISYEEPTASTVCCLTDSLSFPEKSSDPSRSVTTVGSRLASNTSGKSANNMGWWQRFWGHR